MKGDIPKVAGDIFVIIPESNTIDPENQYTILKARLKNFFTVGYYIAKIKVCAFKLLDYFLFSILCLFTISCFLFHLYYINNVYFK